VTVSDDNSVLRKSATLRDVALAAGVHPSTASRALNESTRPMVKVATVRKVLSAADRLGYRPNSLARGLKMSRTFTVGVLIPDLTNPLFPPVVRGLEDGMAGPGYTVVAANTDGDDDKERAIVEAMLNRRIDGLVVATARREHPLVQELARSGIPLVLVVRTVDDSPVSAVVGDDHEGIGLAVRHLVALGHTRIAHVAGPQDVSAGLVRYHSFLSWMGHVGLPVDEDLVVFTDAFQEAPGAEAFRTLLDRRVEFTAAIAGNDLIALGCYDVMAERGLHIPQDVSVVGYNDILFCDKFNPPLTTVRIPSYQMGLKAAELLLDAIKSPGDAPISLRLKPQLMQRRSTGPVRS
jgi:LacI family transcriptional regulator